MPIGSKSSMKSNFEARESSEFEQIIPHFRDLPHDGKVHRKETLITLQVSFSLAKKKKEKGHFSATSGRRSMGSLQSYHLHDDCKSPSKKTS